MSRPKLSERAAAEAESRLIVRFLEEGASPALVSRATGLDLLEVIKVMPARVIKVAEAEELGEAAARLCWLAIQEGVNMVLSAPAALRVRLIGSIVPHAMRRMTTDTSRAEAGMMALLDEIRMGGDAVYEEGEVLPDDEDSQVIMEDEAPEA